MKKCIKVLTTQPSLMETGGLTTGSHLDWDELELIEAAAGKQA